LLRRLRRVVARSRQALGLAPAGESSDLIYWEQRARDLGRRAVISVNEPDPEAVRRRELGTLLPLLKAELRGDERLVVDLGCGPGRFTRELAAAIGGRALGVDPIQRLIDLAPRDPSVEYRRMDVGEIPLGTGQADVVWVCQILGGLVDDAVLERTLAELDRVLTEDGLVFLVEDTTDRDDLPYWRYRSIAEYIGLFEFAPLRIVGEYADRDDEISILAGRKSSPR
jgi:SAM-dependent methyltransferase